MSLWSNFNRQIYPSDLPLLFMVRTFYWLNLLVLFMVRKKSTTVGLLSEMAKNSSWPVTGLGNKGPLKVLNGNKLILDDHGNNLDSFRISLESFRSFRGPYTPQTSNLSGTIFCRFLQQTGSTKKVWLKDLTMKSNGKFNQP